MPNEDALERIATALEELVVTVNELMHVQASQIPVLYRIATSLEKSEDPSIHTNHPSDQGTRARRARIIVMQKSLADDINWFNALVNDSTDHE